MDVKYSVTINVFHCSLLTVIDAQPQVFGFVHFILLNKC